MKVGILGAWHLGAVAACCLAPHHNVWVFDKDANESLQKGIPVVDEPGLSELLKKFLGQSLYVGNEKEVIEGSSYVIIAYDSPVNEEDKVDISPILDSAVQIKKYGKNCAVIIMSQLPVGTCRKIQDDLGMPVLYVPENLRLGQAIECFSKPDVLVIGSDSKALSEKVSEELYSNIVGPRAFLSLESAEMWKHSMNAYLASMITLANSLADVCQNNGANVIDVVSALKMDSRISKKAPLGAGLGFGGGTLGRDVCVLQSLCRNAGANPVLFDAIISYNRSRPLWVLEQLKKKGSLNSMTIAVFGIAYKPGTNTLRRSTGLHLAKLLQAEGAIIKMFDPAISDATGFPVCKSIEDACAGADAVVIITDWPQFKQIDWNAIKKVVRSAFVLDCKNMMNAEQKENIIKAGFAYQGVGV